MHKKFTVVLVAGIIVALSAGFTLVDSDSDPQKGDIFSFTYADANSDLQLALVESNIHMSSPLKLNGFSIQKYCTFFSDELVQNSIDYCTSTEILDSRGGFLGNIQMVGSNHRPEYVITAIQTDHIVSESTDLKTIIQTVVDTLICSCWEIESPGGFATIPMWIDATLEHHESGVSTTSRSTVSDLAGKNLLLELTANPEGYLWKLVVSN